jgi:hypothetical protein
VPDPRGPWDVPDEPGFDVRGIDVSGGFDTDGDGVPDTLVVDDGFDLIVATDLDADGFADQIVTIDAHARVHDVIMPFGEAASGSPH